ncbi:HlyC/CorC family transporter [Anaerolineae bacterium CFX4]|nr:HlyC/CorC family transporter [Anaerolineae bacterium CFX4]
MQSLVPAHAALETSLQRLEQSLAFSLGQRHAAFPSAGVVDKERTSRTAADHAHQAPQAEPVCCCSTGSIARLSYVRRPDSVIGPQTGLLKSSERGTWYVLPAVAEPQEAAMLSELLIILALTLANGFFSGSELAIVSARVGRLDAMAKGGSRPARQALNLAKNPDRFLATVQVGITLIGTFSAAFGGARIGDILAGWIAQVPALEPHAETLGLLIVVVVITYLSLVLGELVPKRLAIQNAERLAVIAAPVMTVLSALTRPIVGILTLSVAGVMRVLGQRVTDDDAVTEEDIAYLVREGAESGVVEREEARIIERVFRFTDRPVSAIMTPRTQFTAVSVDQSLSEVMDVFKASRFSRLPLYEGTIDHVVGVLHVKDFISAFASGTDIDLRAIARPPLFVVESLHGDDVLFHLRQQGAQIAFVIDEYGQIMGLVTIEDLIEELVGEIRDEFNALEGSTSGEGW